MTNKRGYDTAIHHRHSLRLKTHDYTDSRAYFVTICAKVREPIFDIPELATILTTTWQELPQRFPGITLDEFVIMPDHVHFMIWLNGRVENAPGLSAVVGAYKSLTTNAWLRYIAQAKLERPGIIWQRNYIDRILSDQNALDATRQYIRNNPNKLKKRDTH